MNKWGVALASLAIIVFFCFRKRKNAFCLALFSPASLARVHRGLSRPLVIISLVSSADRLTHERTMEEVNELVEVADAVRHQFASADDAAKLAAAAAVTSDLEALCASRESDARAVIEREFGESDRWKREAEREKLFFFAFFQFVENDARSQAARKNGKAHPPPPPPPPPPTHPHTLLLPHALSKKTHSPSFPSGLTRVAEAETAASAPPPEAAAHDERLAAAQARAASASAAAATARAAVAALHVKKQQTAEQLLNAEADAEADEALDAYEEPRMRAALSLFVNISSVAWQMGSCCAETGKVVGTFGGHKASRLSRHYGSSSSSSSSSGAVGLRRFQFEEENTPRYDLVNSMWDMIGR